MKLYTLLPITSKLLTSRLPHLPLLPQPSFLVNYSVNVFTGVKSFAWQTNDLILKKPGSLFYSDTSYTLHEKQLLVLWLLFDVV